jgi:hypothetical protein
MLRRDAGLLEICVEVWLDTLVTRERTEGQPSS